MVALRASGSLSQRGGNWPPPALATSVSTDSNLLEHQTHRHFSFKMASHSSKLWNLLHQSLSIAYAENDVRNACFSARRYSNVNRIARLNGIPRSTLRWRLQGLLPRLAAHAHEMRLSLTLKTELAEFIPLQAAIGAPLTHGMIRELA